MEAIIDRKINDWKIEPTRYYTEDDLINAYLKGKQEGMNIEKKVMIEKFHENLLLATNEGINIFKEITKEKVNCLQCFLKIENTISFHIIYIIDSKDYTEENLNKIYLLSRNKKHETNKDTFEINFSFMPSTETLNEKRLIADGYTLNYNPKA